MKFASFILLCFMISAVLAPLAVTAQTAGAGVNTGIVPCDGTEKNPCKPCHIVVLAIRLINFGINYLAAPLAVLMLSYAGLVFVTSFGRPDRIKAGKTILTNTVIGIIIVFGGYFLVDIAIKGLTGNLSGTNFLNVSAPWNDPFQSKDNKYLSECRNEIPGNKTPQVRTGDVEREAGRINQVIIRIASILGFILLSISPLMILYSAFLYTTAGGNEDNIESARRVLLFALVGIVVAALAFAIPALVANFFGPTFEFKDIF